MIEQMLDRRGRPLPAAARRPLPHCLELCRDRPQTEVRIGNGNAGDECHQSILRLSSRRALDKFRLREAFPHSDASVEQPGVEFLQVFEAEPRREEALAHSPTWFSTWPFSQPDAGVQATGSTR